MKRNKKVHSETFPSDPQNYVLQKSQGIDHEKSNCAPIKLEECNNTSSTDKDGKVDQHEEYYIQITSNERNEPCKALECITNNLIKEKQQYTKALVSQKEEIGDSPNIEGESFIFSLQVPGVTSFSSRLKNTNHSSWELGVFIKNINPFGESNCSDYIKPPRDIVYTQDNLEEEKKCDEGKDSLPSLTSPVCSFVRHSWNRRSNWYKVCRIIPGSVGVERSILASTTSQTFQAQSVIQAAKECSELVNNIREDNDAIYKDVNDIDTYIGRQTTKDIKSVLSEMKSEIANMVAEANELEATSSDSEPTSWEYSDDSELNFSETDEDFEPDLSDGVDYSESDEDLNGDLIDSKSEIESMVAEANKHRPYSMDSEPITWYDSDNDDVDGETDEDIKADPSDKHFEIANIVELKASMIIPKITIWDCSDSDEIKYSETDEDSK